MRIRFLSSNKFKIAEVREILGDIGVEVIAVDHKIEELQTDDVKALVRDKCIKAFKRIGRPLFVEHTGLNIRSLNGFPGGLTQIFWDTLQADRFTELLGQAADPGVTARTTIGFCDGKAVLFFEGEIEGSIPRTPRGDRAFQWDCAFIPVGESETFAEMGTERKNTISMRRKAIDAFATYLRSTYGI